jgi:hypothetical protein
MEIVPYSSRGVMISFTVFVFMMILPIVLQNIARILILYRRCGWDSGVDVNTPVV